MQITPAMILVLLGMSLFFGLAFEEFYAKRIPDRPGGIRTFPLLALTGAALFALQPGGLAFTGGLLVVGAWLFLRDREIKIDAPSPLPLEGKLVIPICNLLAYALGALALSQPPWVIVAVTVAATLLLAGRERLHRIAETVPIEELFIAGQFLLLVGVMLPLLPDTAIPNLGGLTPHRLALAVVAVCSLSYGGYLLERYARPKDAVLLAGVLGGLYSSTATTAALARRSRSLAQARSLNVAVILATAVMYVRLFAIVALFNWPLAQILAAPLGMLSALSLALAGAARLLGRAADPATLEIAEPTNPLQLGTSLVFAAALILTTFLSNWAKEAYGRHGVDALAAIVGVTDIDPFVLSVVQGNIANMNASALATAVLLAASSNNAMKALYTLTFGNARRMSASAIALLVLCAAGVSLSGVH